MPPGLPGSLAPSSSHVREHNGGPRATESPNKQYETVRDPRVPSKRQASKSPDGVPGTRKPRPSNGLSLTTADLSNGTAHVRHSSSRENTFNERVNSPESMIESSGRTTPQKAVFAHRPLTTTTISPRPYASFNGARPGPEGARLGRNADSATRSASRCSYKNMLMAFADNTASRACVQVTRDAAAAKLEQALYEHDRNEHHFAGFDAVKELRLKVKNSAEKEHSDLQSKLEDETRNLERLAEEIAAALEAADNQRHIEPSASSTDSLSRELQAGLNAADKEIATLKKEMQHVVKPAVKKVEKMASEWASLQGTISGIAERLKVAENLGLAGSHARDIVSREDVASATNLAPFLTRLESVEAEIRATDQLRKPKDVQLEQLALKVEDDVARLDDELNTLHETFNATRTWVQGHAATVKENGEQLDALQDVVQEHKEELSRVTEKIDNLQIQDAPPAENARNPRSNTLGFQPMLPAALDGAQTPAIDFSVHPALRQLKIDISVAQENIASLRSQHENLITDGLAQQMVDQMHKMYPDAKAIFVAMKNMERQNQGITNTQQAIRDRLNLTDGALADVARRASEKDNTAKEDPQVRNRLTRVEGDVATLVNTAGQHDNLIKDVHQKYETLETLTSQLDEDLSTLNGRVNSVVSVEAGGAVA